MGNQKEPYYDIDRVEIVNYIYALIDPRNGVIRYIGKSKDPDDRYAKHLKPYYLKPDTHKNRWLRQLLRCGLKPWMVIMCEVDATEDINRIERDFIRWMNVNGKLTNLTLGGDGGAPTVKRKLPPRGPSPMRGVPWDPNDPRRELLRSRQAGNAPMHATKKAEQANRCTWKLTDPFGGVYIVHGLAEFAKAHGLTASKLAAVSKGNPSRTHHKRWLCEKLEGSKRFPISKGDAK